MSDSETKTCPFCAEEILVAAVKCKHCGEFLPDSAVTTTPPTPVGATPTAGAKPPSTGGGGLSAKQTRAERNKEQLEALRSWWRGAALWARVAVVCVAVALFAGIAILYANREKPISQQSCSELAKTFNGIAEVQSQPDSSFEDKQQSMTDADELNKRVDELGGCPGEPSLQ